MKRIAAILAVLMFAAGMVAGWSIAAFEPVDLRLDTAQVLNPDGSIKEYRATFQQRGELWTVTYPAEAIKKLSTHMVLFYEGESAKR